MFLFFNVPCLKGVHDQKSKVRGPGLQDGPAADDDNNDRKSEGEHVRIIIIIRQSRGA